MAIDRDYYDMTAWTLEHSIEIAKIGAGHEGYRAYNGSGGLWAGSYNGMADAQFDDWGLARATAEILNAVIDGRLVPAKASDQN